jgi:hypothetical protein
MIAVVSMVITNRLYVANSDPEDPHWRVFTVTKQGQLTDSRVFVHAAQLQVPQPRLGNPDGFKIDTQVRTHNN